MAKEDRFFFLRLAVILAVGAAAIIVAAFLRRPAGRWTPAPETVQQAGRKLVSEVLASVGTTEFGRSQRGRRLAKTIGDFLRRGRLVFTDEIASQALFRREPGGEEFLYVRVLRLGGRLEHQTTEQVAEGLFHEAVHACDATDESSIEEECDGFAAGLCAGAAVTGRTPPELLRIEGQSVAEFVLQQYPDLPRGASYQPVGQSREWLSRRTGLGRTR